MIETKLLERNELDHVCSLGALTGEHILIAGEPGTAKSLHAERFFAHFPTARKFSVQLSKFSTEEVVFGPLDVPKLREGEYAHAYENSILDSHFAFIDEIFDASDVLLRSLLGVLNERKFQRGNFKVMCPLISAIGTANYTRINNVTEAVVDRFLFQMWVKPIEDKTALIDFDESFTPDRKFNLTQLKSMQSEVARVKLPKKLREPFIEVAHHLGFTDRRIVKAVKVLKASAFMRGYKEVQWEDLRELKYLNSLDDKNQKSTEAVITDLVESTLNINKQLNEVKKLHNQFENIEGSHTDPEHLAKERAVLKKMLAISPYDEEVAETRDGYYREHNDHFERNRSEFQRRLKID